jgi:hypothetical protein
MIYIIINFNSIKSVKGIKYRYVWFWLNQFKLCVNSVQNLSFYISDLNSYTAIKKEQSYWFHTREPHYNII